MVAMSYILSHELPGTRGTVCIAGASPDNVATHLSELHSIARRLQGQVEYSADLQTWMRLSIDLASASAIGRRELASGQVPGLVEFGAI